VLALFGQDEMVPEHTSNLEALQSQNHALLEIVYLNAAGQVLAHAPRQNAVLANLFTIPQSTWFVQARQGRSYVGDVQFSASEEAYLILALPVASDGVIAARLDMKVLRDVVANLPFGKSGISYLVNQNGRIIAHSEWTDHRPFRSPYRAGPNPVGRAPRAVGFGARGQQAPRWGIPEFGW